MRIELATRDIRRSWFRWTTAGEFAGFLAPALAGALTSSPQLLVVAGVVEGAVLGAAQAVVLRRVDRTLNSYRWIGATALAAGFAWALAMLVVRNSDRLNALPLAAVLPIAAVAGVGVLLSLGTAQWFVLRDHFPRAQRWIWANAFAWGAGLLVFTAVTTPLWQPGQPPELIALIGALGGLLMAATMAAVTGAALTRLVRDRGAPDGLTAFPPKPSGRETAGR
ncbi:hypothetical protein SK571_23410 [Lentzea sp. BCCO 10_0798]|uniref:DUF2231 domain-containing protein n=1 Tax=Lentzea kristufekii TaxID=3095430 RepID=A0ABU4TVL2_9PSEU|nr:hypothetical protein [Lentzea sp. BCCO 10_0798]MDX8052345.1 hypothetical protein [Lentzea sp. BCCO 10_0798]